MQFILGPKQDRPLTIVMTEQQAKDFVDRYHDAPFRYSHSRFPGERVLANLVAGIKETLSKEGII